MQSTSSYFTFSYTIINILDEPIICYTFNQNQPEKNYTLNLLFTDTGNFDLIYDVTISNTLSSDHNQTKPSGQYTHHQGGEFNKFSFNCERIKWKVINELCDKMGITYEWQIKKKKYIA